MKINAFSRKGNLVGEVEVESVSKPGQRYSVYKNYKPMSLKEVVRDSVSNSKDKRS